MPMEITKEFVRARVRDPGDFVSGSLRTITLSEAEAIQAVSGRLKTGDATAIQSYLFDKGKWDVGQVKDWLAKHNLTVKGMEGDEIAISPERVAFGYDAFEVKEAVEGIEKHLYIEGFATTSAKDRQGDIIDKAFYEVNIKRKTLEQAKTLLLNHDKSLPIGAVVDAQLKEKKAGEWGLWVKAMISNAAAVDDVRKQIKEGTLNAFSFRWHPAEGGEEPIKGDNGAVTGMRVKDGTIIEFSVVSLPANPRAEIDRWYEKALPDFGVDVKQAVAAAEDANVKATELARLAQVAVEKAIADVEKKRLEDEEKKKREGKLSADATSNKGTQDNNMELNVIKSILATLTKAQWDAFSADVKKEILTVDSAVETRLELASLKAEKDALATKAIELEKQLAAAVKPAELTPEQKAIADAKAKTYTADEAAKMVEDKVKEALGKTAAKSVAADGSKTTDMPGAPAVRVKMFAAPEAEGKELTEDEIAKKLIGQFFMSGKEGRAQIATLVKELGGQA